MTDMLAHRGPDDRGTLLAPGIALGFRRLGIIDLESGNQPLENEDGSIAVVCNGEIYNYLELMKELRGRGHRFRSACDAEVIVHLYEDEGERCLERLRGMFGLAIWDGVRKELILARDRLGIKPLHYALTTEGICFASEQKAILLHPDVSRDPDFRAMRSMFALGFVCGERTLFSGIRRVLPGQMLRFRQGAVAARSYWQLDLAGSDDGADRLGARDWVRCVRDKLAETVRIHLRSDVPVGAWLSPGIDSSAIVRLMRDNAATSFETFTLACDDPAADETHRHPTLNHYPGFRDIPNTLVEFGLEDFERLPRAVWHCEDPFTSGVEIPRLVLSERSARAYKVVLTGEGADEIFGGYPWFRTEKLLRPFGALPVALRRWVASKSFLSRRWPGACNILSGGGGPLTLDRYGAFIGPPTFPQKGSALFSPQVRERLPGSPSASDPEPARRIRAGKSPFAQLQALDLHYRLPDAVTQHLDRGSMAHALEARVPFLDHELVELCARIPPELQLRGFREKSILRDAMKPDLPAPIVRRRKRAMSAPYASWLRAPLPEFAHEMLSERALGQKGYFDAFEVQALLREHRSRRADHGRILMGVLGVQLWDTLLRNMSASGCTE
jgi:asparagine synthase (glutamine-hydrolysing)